MDIKEALLYANKLIKENSTELKAIPENKNVKDILNHTIAYIMKKVDYDQKAIQNLLNAVYNYYNKIVKESETCDNSNYCEIVNQRYIAYRKCFIGTIIEDYACQLLIDVSNSAICKKFADA